MILVAFASKTSVDRSDSKWPCGSLNSGETRCVWKYTFLPICTHEVLPDSIANPRSHTAIGRALRRSLRANADYVTLIQMEVFTRECLEVDQETDGDKRSSMDQVYERAAKLVKRTLDVEGSIVMDVSHVDVLETTASESSVSVTLYNADSQAGSTSKSLSREDYSKLADFFAKFPEGKICEGVVPASLRGFLPAPFIQYALSKFLVLVLCAFRVVHTCNFAVVPIFNIDKRPFALLCAYSTGERTTPSVRTSRT